MTKRKTYSMAAYANGEKIREFKCASLKDARESVRSFLFYGCNMSEAGAAAVEEKPSHDGGFIYTVNAYRFVRILVA
jgi:hypothetical protein